MAKRKSEHYVNNAQFSQAVMDYVIEVQEAKKSNSKLPIVPNYIADCFLKIAKGLSHRDNFIRYSFREEMVMDAVENCLKAIENYNLEAATRTGKPNAFAYFTQISWYAFLRRIAKEQKQQDIKNKYITQAGIGTMAMVHLDRPDHLHSHVINSYMSDLKSKMESTKEKDSEEVEYKATPRKKSIRLADSNLEEFMEDE